MAIYYVDSNASGLNNGTSKTDAAESLNYLLGTIGTVIDSEILFSHLHNHDYPTSQSIFFPTGGRMVMKSIDYSDDSYASGAVESALTAVTQLWFRPTSNSGTKLIFSGVDFICDTDWRTGGNGCDFWFENCTIGSIAGNVYICLNDGQRCVLKDVTIDCVGGATGQIYVQSGGFAHLMNISPAAGYVAADNLFNIGGSGGGNLLVEDSDLTGFLTASGNLVNISTGADIARAVFRKCKLPSSWSYNNGVDDVFILDISECDIGDGYYYFLYVDSVSGQAEMDTAQYVVSGADVPKYDGTNAFSVQIDTVDNCNAYLPFRYKLASFGGQDLTTAKTVAVELSGPAGLTDADVYLEIVIQDTTDQALGVRQDTRAADPESGTALTAGAATWQNTSPTEYQITKDLGAQSGLTNSNVDVYICVAKPSVSALNVSLPTIGDT